MIVRLAFLSLRNRWITCALTVIAIAVSVMLVLGVEEVRTGARASFADTISGTDLIVGARTGDVNLLLYTVFHIGNPTNNMTWKTFQDIAKRPEVAWIVPISLGDSHKGFRVAGTSAEFFQRYQYRSNRKLSLAGGKPLSDLFDTVVGADVAAQLNYRVGDKVIVAHGLGATSFAMHDDKPFTVSGVLAKTGTPVDRTVFISMEAIVAIHIDWQSGAKIPGRTVNADQVRATDLQPKEMTAALVGLKSKLGAFSLQRWINDYKEEAMSAILPGIALQELWGLIGTAETALSVVSVMTVITALLGMTTMVLATLNERRREMAILRSVGARPATILGLLATEALMLTSAGVVAGCLALYSALWLLRPFIDRQFGLYLAIDPPTEWEWSVLGFIIVAGLAAGSLPAIRAYRLSLADGMIVRT